MRRELDKALVDDFPTLYRDRHADMRSTGMFWGFETGDGWYGIIRRLSERLTELDAKHSRWYRRLWAWVCWIAESLGRRRWYTVWYALRCGWPESSTIATQVKEKFGGLRFYISGGSEEAYTAIDEAAAESYRTCEHCGEPGKCNERGWLATLCDNCRADV